MFDGTQKERPVEFSTYKENSSALEKYWWNLFFLNDWSHLNMVGDSASSRWKHTLATWIFFSQNKKFIAGLWMDAVMRSKKCVAIELLAFWFYSFLQQKCTLTQKPPVGFQNPGVGFQKPRGGFWKSRGGFWKTHRWVLNPKPTRGF